MFPRRFDLVYIMLDRPDEELDHRLSDHVMALHSGASTSARSCVGGGVSASNVALRRSGSTSSLLAGATPAAGGDEEETLIERLRLHRGERVERLPHPLLSKYISYARKYVYPK